MKRTYEVIVGNVGNAYYGHNKREATRTFNAYRKVSKSGIGRCALEPVTLIIDDTIADEYEPTDSTVPADFPVRPLLTSQDKAGAVTLAKCGTCGRCWDDSICTGWTPVPAGRCPFEHFHA